jgi:4-hydroxy-tetrahydrodipicolinate reductase
MLTQPEAFKVAVYGMGKMGKLIAQQLQNHVYQQPNLVFGLGFDKNTALSELLHYDAVIDFSTTTASLDLIQWLNTHKDQLKPHFCYVSGVTGFDMDLSQLLGGLSKDFRVFYASNFSLGILVLNQLLKQASAFLNDFDIEIFELHHKQKKDSPSGTALTLAKSMAEARENAEIQSNRPNLYPRTSDQIHISAGRGGQIIGEHQIYLIGESERIEFVHRAQNRILFADGAIKSLHWLTRQNQGLYGMDEMWHSFIAHHPSGD